MKLQQLILRAFLVVQIMGVVTFCCVGEKGLLSSRRNKCEHEMLRVSIQNLQSEIDDLQQKIHEWKTNDFYKEQCVREQLQMARPEEEVYVLD